MNKDHESTTISYSSNQSLEARAEIFELLKNYEGTPGEVERSLGLFLRGSLLARILATAEIYKKIVDIPGAIFDLGTWRGQTSVLCENLRAIYEPLNFNRRIVCFDTFEGYKGFSSKDTATQVHHDGTYSLGLKYAEFLRNLLLLHEQSNAMGHVNGKHKVVEGDIRETLPAFFKQSPNEFVSLAFFDVNSYEPTQEAFKIIYSRLVPGGIVVFWQLTRDLIPAEGNHYASDILRNNEYQHTVHKVPIYPGLCYIQRK